MTWYVYILECSDGTLYTGITNDVERRVHRHNNWDSQAARYTRMHRPVKLLYQEEHETRGLALKREYVIKRLSRKKKLQLIGI